MRKDEVRTAEDALAYFADCALATVVDMNHKTRKPVGEFKRHIAIAQFAVDQCVLQCSEYSSTRVADVIAKGKGSVEKWLDTKEAA